MILEGEGRALGARERRVQGRPCAPLSSPLRALPRPRSAHSSSPQPPLDRSLFGHSEGALWRAESVREAAPKAAAKAPLCSRNSRTRPITQSTSFTEIGYSYHGRLPVAHQASTARPTSAARNPGGSR